MYKLQDALYLSVHKNSLQTLYTVARLYRKIVHFYLLVYSVICPSNLEEGSQFSAQSEVSTIYFFVKEISFASFLPHWEDRVICLRSALFGDLIHLSQTELQTRFM